MMLHCFSRSGYFVWLLEKVITLFRMMPHSGWLAGFLFTLYSGKGRTNGFIIILKWIPSMKRKNTRAIIAVVEFYAVSDTSLVFAISSERKSQIWWWRQCSRVYCQDKESFIYKKKKTAKNDKSTFQIESNYMIWPFAFMLAKLDYNSILSIRVFDTVATYKVKAHHVSNV